jgi:hypothetical protein
MFAANLVCRRARLEDLCKALPLWASDHLLYDPDIWRSLPALLDDLIVRELVSFVIIQSVPDRVPRTIIGSSFIRPGYVTESLSGCSLPNLVMTAALLNRNPFLSPREVSEENARGTLHLMNFFGIQDALNVQNPDSLSLHSTLQEGHRFFHLGYSYRAMWFEVWQPHQIDTLQSLGMRIERRMPLAGKETASLMRFTTQDAQADPHAWFSSYFFPPKPRFHFSRGEQRLLECSLLDLSDADATQELHVSEDGIKKRWRSIYVRVNEVDRDLLAGICSGSAQRRCLLHYLRQHLEELRPYTEQHAPLLNMKVTAFQRSRAYQSSHLQSRTMEAASLQIPHGR